MRGSSFCRGFCLFVVVLLFLPDLSHAASGGKSWKPSRSQRLFVNAYGHPELFMLVFDYPAGKGTARPRRIESWIYLSRSKFVLFDNGFFSEEQPTGTGKSDVSPVPHTRLRPSNFNASMKESDIVRAYGKPGSVETAALGAHHFRTLRYLNRDRSPGILNVTFYDGKLAGVVAGFAIKSPDMEVLKREIRRAAP